MTNKEFIAQLAEKAEMSASETQKLVRTAFNAITDELEEGESVTYNGLGTFEVRKRLERIMKNPTTGKRMLVPPKLVVNFKPYSALKEILK